MRIPTTVGINNSTKTNKVLVGDLYRRDGQQSTLSPKNMLWDLGKIAELSAHAAKAKFDFEETNGGNFPSAALQNGVNAFRINQQVHEIVKGALQKDGQEDLAPFSSVLFRGKSVFTLSTFSPNFVEAAFIHTIKKAGNKLIRVFDGLNDIKGIVMTDKMRETAKEYGANIQGSLCTGPSLDQIRKLLGDKVVDSYMETLSPEQQKAYENLHTDEYYTNYAKKLVEEGFDSIVIKDLSGVFDPERIREFVPNLKRELRELQDAKQDDPKVKQHDIPIYLHYHSTNLEKTKKVMAVAIDNGIDAIETVNGPLGNGTAHIELNSLDAFTGNNPKIQIDKSQFPSYEELLSEAVAGNAEKRLDNFGDHTERMLSMLEEHYFAGGAAASGIANAKTLTPGIKETDLIDDSNIDKLDPVLRAKVRYSAWMHLLMGLPPEVTPIPAIKTFQATLNLQNNRELMEKIPNGDATDDDLFNLDTFSPAFLDNTVKLINGHFGKVNAYITDDDGSVKVVRVETEELKSRFQSMVDGNGFTGFIKTTANRANDAHPDLGDSDVLDAYAEGGQDHLAEAYDKADALVDKYGIVAKSFGSKEDLAILAQQSQIVKGSSIPTIDMAMLGHKNRVKENFNKFMSSSNVDKLSDEEKQVLEVLPNLQYLIAPLFEYFDAMVKLGTAKEGDFTETQISEFGGTASDQKAVYEVVKESLASFKDALPDSKEFSTMTVKGLVNKISKLTQLDKIAAKLDNQEIPLELDGKVHQVNADAIYKGLKQRSQWQGIDRPDETTAANLSLIQKLHKEL